MFFWVWPAVAIGYFLFELVDLGGGLIGSGLFLFLL